MQGLLAFFGSLVEEGEIREDIPLPVLVRALGDLVVFFVLSKVVAFGDGSPRVELPFADEIRGTGWIRRDGGALYGWRAEEGGFVVQIDSLRP